MNIEELGSSLTNEVTIKELSAAIRKNGVPQITGQYFKVDENNDIIAACALGQAAMNLKTHAGSIIVVDDQPTMCPIDEQIMDSVTTTIIHLNDNHKQTLDFIADWLDTL